MARYPVLPGLLLLVACGGGGTDPVNPPPPPPPPSQPGTPASLSVMAGDGQQASPGVAVAILPSVLVKDAAGRPVPSVTVTFSVDSGGGSLAGSSASTNAAGIATSGVWTLGPAEAPNVLVAAVAGVASVKLRATGRFADAVIADQVIPAGGGTISYTKPGDPLDGFTLTVPPVAYAGAQSWRVVGLPKLKVTLPAGLSQVGGGVLIGNDQGYTDSLVVVRLPMQVGLDTALAAFMYDTVTHYLEAVPVAARDSASLTVVLTHVGSRFLWQPPAPGSSLRAPASAVSSFDPVAIVVAALPVAQLNAIAVSGFLPGTDDWEFTNWGSELDPGGICLGMSVSAMYFYDRIKPASGKKLYEEYDEVAGYDWDNPQGIRFASMVQFKYGQQVAASIARENAIVKLAQKGGVSLDLLVYQSLVVAIRATTRPQLFTMDNGPGTGGHAVVAYSALGGTVRLADPNQPGAPGVTATFANGRFQPVNLRPVAGAPSRLYSRVFVPGSSTYISTASIDAEWQKFVTGTAGDGTFTATSFEIPDLATGGFTPLGDSVSVWTDVLELAWHCPSCAQKHTVASNVITDAGKRLANPVDVLTLGGRDRLGMMSAFGVNAFNNFKWVVVKSEKFALKVTSSEPIEVLAPASFVARSFGKAPPNARYEWDFGDNTGVVTMVNDSTVTHTFQRKGNFNVFVTMKDQAGKKLAESRWRFPVVLSLFVVPRNGVIGLAYQFTARAGEPDPGATYSWDFGDHTPAVVSPDSNATHTWTQPGTYTVKVVYHGTTYTETAQATVHIYPGEWRLTSLTLQKTVLPKTGTAQRKIEAFDSLTKYLKQVEQKPSDGMLFLADGNLWRETGVYFQVAPAGTGASLEYWGPGSQVWMVARTSSIQFSSFQNTGPLTNGSVTGVGYVTLFYNPPAVSGGEFLNYVTAAKSGNTLSGTLRFTLYDGSPNPAEKAYGFSAQLVP